MNLTNIRVPIIDTRTIATRTERHYCSCLACGKTTTVDFTVHLWEFLWYNWQAGQDAWEPRTTYTTEQGKEVANTSISHCPECHAPRPVSRRLKSAKFSARHQCNDKCKNAISEICQCSCNGLNHGINHKQQGLTLF